jgi:hypothetical protein
MNKFRLIFHYNSKVMFKKRLVVPKAYPCLQTQTAYIKDKMGLLRCTAKQIEQQNKLWLDQIYCLCIPFIE